MPREMSIHVSYHLIDQLWSDPAVTSREVTGIVIHSVMTG